MPDGRLCTSFDKTGTFIRTVTVTRDKRGPICTSYAFVEILDASGQVIAREVGSYYPPCRFGGVMATLTINQDFPDGRRACAGVAEGVRPSPRVCVAL